MAVYFCKCGRQVNKSTNADNTGNRDTAQCTGCPYLLPWGPNKYVEGQGFHKDVQGYECRMSPTLCYTTTYRGQASDKCTLHILSLDLDFLDTVQAWIDDHAADTLSAGFSRGSMRGTDFSDKGRYSLSISCAQNKKGMAAKAALIEQFFTGGRVRKDMTLVQEKARILDAIRKGKEQAQRKDTTMKKRDCDYYVNNRYCTEGIPDQDELLTEEELRQEREREERYLASLSAEPAEPVVYQNEYGTLFAVREHKGAPALMCKAKEADSWALSGVLAAVQGEAYTAADQQEVLDEYARAHGWKKAAPEQTKEDYSPCEGCRCPDCDDEACPQAHCDKSDKGLGCIAPDGLCPPVNPTDAAADAPPCAPTVSDAQPLPSPNADAGAKEGANDCKADGAASQNCPFYDVKEYSDNSEGHFCHLCGSLKRPHKVCLGKYKDDWHKCDVFIKYDGAEQLLTRNASSSLSATIQTTQTIVESSDIADDGRATSRPCPGDVYRSAKGGQLYKIGELTNGKKTCYLTMRSNAQGGTWVPANSSVYPNLSDAQGEFEAWIRTKQLEPVAPTGAAAATTDASAAPQPSQAAGTTTTSASGAGASTSTPQESGISGRNSSPAPGCPAEDGDAASVAKPAASPVTTPSNLPAFDYSGLDAQTVQDLHLAEREVAGGRRMAEIGLRRMADGVAIAHDALCGSCDNLSQLKHGNRGDETFGRWCDSVGLNRKAAERLLQVSKLFDDSTPREQKVLEELGPSLLYAAAKPSAPAELVQAVKDGDITSHKQYQDLLARYNAEKAAREQAEQDNDFLRADSAKARDAAHTYHRQYDEVAAQRNALIDQQGENIRLRIAAEKERDEALKQRDGARDALTASKLRGDKLKAENEALKARPIEARVVDEEEIERRAQARADELTAPMREELEALRARHPADLEEAEQAIRDAYDSAIYTGRVMENAWHTLRPLLPRMDAHRRELAINQVSKTLSQIQGEIAACL